MSNLVREKVEDYFATMNTTSRRMMDDINTFKGQSKNLIPVTEGNTIWGSFVDPEVAKKYENVPSESIGVEYFPVLKTRPGQKIVVDEGCTWRDEHSAPFRWKTRSQLDLHLDPDDLSSEKAKTPEKEISKDCTSGQDKTQMKKEDEVKRSTLPVKRPEVPPPPVPPHIISPVQPLVELFPPPTTLKKDDTVIYAKVVKRKSGSSKTLVLSEMKAHRKAKEDMKPAVPPRMSLELRGEINISKYKTLPIDFDNDIPKTGFDFLDNW